MSGDLLSYSVDQADEYWYETRRPLVCLLFLAPLLVVYELGVLWTGGLETADVRNRADSWMRSGLQIAGIEHSLVLPASVVAILLVWHLAGRFVWRVRPSAFVGMFAESLLFAFVLILVGQLHTRMLGGGGEPPAALAIHRETAQLAVSFLGAGLYEEVLFRLMLLPAIYGVLRLVRMSPGWAGSLAVLLTGITFAAAHHLELPEEPVAPAVFTFRAVAGVFFAGLFYWRGFGITVGTHAAYDLLVGIVLAPEA